MRIDLQRLHQAHLEAQEARTGGGRSMTPFTFSASRKAINKFCQPSELGKARYQGT
jgi:hypothetical protein